MVYGLDPHTGTHDMIIRNNTVHDNGAAAIICSLNCYNITIENNKVYNSKEVHGIMFSKNTHDSIARNNIVSNSEKCISVSQSHNNEVYNNRVSACDIGIVLSGNSSNNVVHDNTIANSKVDISTAAYDDNDARTRNNKLYSNKIVGDNSSNVTSTTTKTESSSSTDDSG
jgi:poly(beta-D-mannuronate) C5 epimerase